MTFEELKITRQFLNAIDDCGYSSPSPIQEKAIPRISAGQDVIGIAQTGTGKTAAFALPVLVAACLPEIAAAQHAIQQAAQRIGMNAVVGCEQFHAPLVPVPHCRRARRA